MIEEVAFEELLCLLCVSVMPALAALSLVFTGVAGVVAQWRFALMFPSVAMLVADHFCKGCLGLVWGLGMKLKLNFRHPFE
jgi:hypothetical protein